MMQYTYPQAIAWSWPALGSYPNARLLDSESRFRQLKANGMITATCSWDVIWVFLSTMREGSISNGNGATISSLNARSIVHKSLGRAKKRESEI